MLALEAQGFSAVRVTPACAHFGSCGGCQLQHIPYPEQVRWKIERLTELLAQEAGLAAGEVPIEAVAMEEPWGYRSKMEFTFAQTEGQLTLGFHERGNFHRIVDVNRCPIAHPTVSDLVRAIKEEAKGFGLTAYHPKRHQGYWRHAVVRVNGFGELLLMIVTNDGPEAPVRTLAQVLPQRVPALKGLFWGISTRLADTALPERTVHLWGDQTLQERVGEIRFRLGPSHFVQPNLRLRDRLYDTIRRKAALTGLETVYDLYCGAGLIALSLAAQARKVVGVESDPGNVALAEQIAQDHRISNVLFISARVEDVLKAGALLRGEPQPVVIVLDPPRAGVHPAVLAPLVAAQARRLLYLSCNPATLVRDVKGLIGRDSCYRVESVQMFDFFPHTPHQEVLISLTATPSTD